MKRLIPCALLAGFLSASAHAAWLGGEFDTQPKDRFPGVIVRSVADGSPAAQAGLRQGDVIVAVQLRPINKAPDLTRLVRNAPAGTRVSFALLRDGTPVEAIAVLAGAPSQSAKAAAPATLHAAATTGSRLPRHTSWSGVFVEVGAGATPAEPRSQSLSHR
jgi:membrane-associated protease RseP (regulator of RpoE activity)